MHTIFLDSLLLDPAGCYPMLRRTFVFAKTFNTKQGTAQMCLENKTKTTLNNSIPSYREKKTLYIIAPTGVSSHAVGEPPPY